MANRTAGQTCAEEQMMLVDPVEHMREMPRKFEGPYHLFISNCEADEKCGFAQYRAAVAWWSKLADYLLQYS